MDANIYADEPRAEELIAEIYRQIHELRLNGKTPEKVCLPITYIRRLRIYQSLIGVSNRDDMDYLDHDSIFGLDFFVHDLKKIIVV